MQANWSVDGEKTGGIGNSSTGYHQQAAHSEDHAPAGLMILKSNTAQTGSKLC